MNVVEMYEWEFILHTLFVGPLYWLWIWFVLITPLWVLFDHLRAPHAVLRAPEQVPDERSNAELEIAAKDGDREAQFLLGQNLYVARGEESVPVDAVSWLCRAALHRHGKAQTLLGHICVDQGAELPRCAAQALFERAATEHNDPLAKFNLGVMHEKRREKTEALGWYQAAANDGDADAQFALSHFYRRGRGCEKDLAAAYFWLRLAADNGHRSALARERRLKRKLSDDQIRQAQRLIDLHRPPSGRDFEIGAEATQ